MKKFNAALSIFIIATSSALAGNACMPIAEACMKAGYYEGGDTEGKGVAKNCVEPIAAQKMTLSGSAFSDTVLSECRAEIAQKMKSNQ
jgi:hypothetical protein